MESIKSVLEKRNPGWDIWFDKNDIHAGEDWRAAIYKAISDSDVVVAWLSRHSVRDPGVCLDELRIAASEKTHYITSVLLESPETVAPPISISHIQYLDLSQWQLQRNNDKERFNAWLDEKVGSLEKIISSHSSFSGAIEELKTILNISEYEQSNMDRMNGLLREEFVAREWLQKEIEKWLGSDQGRNVFCVTGEPGIGKSALVAHFASMNSVQVAGVHFCGGGSGLDDPKNVLISLAYQLATRVPSYRRYLLSKKFDVKKMSSGEAFRKLLTEAGIFSIDGGQQRYLLIIDGLNEAAEELAMFIAQKQRELPPWLYLLVTSRPNEAHVKPHLAALNPFILSASDHRNERDARRYAERMLQGANLTLPERMRIAENLCETSEGNFRYLAFIRDMIRSGSLDPRDFLKKDVFPAGLASLYQRFMEQAFPDREEFEGAPRIILSVLAGLGSTSISKKLLISILESEFKISQSEIAEILIRLGSLIKFEGFHNDNVSLYHKSVSDWLLADANFAYALDVEETQTRLVKLLWNRFMRDADLDAKDDGERLKRFEDNVATAFLQILLNRLAPGSGVIPQRLENVERDFLKQAGITKKSFDKYQDRFPAPVENQEACRHADILIYLLNEIFYGKYSSEAAENAWRLNLAFPPASYPDWSVNFFEDLLAEIGDGFGMASEEYFNVLLETLAVYGEHPDPRRRLKKKAVMEEHLANAAIIFSKDKTLLAKFYNEFANLYAEDNYYEEAFELYGKALKRARKDYRQYFNELPKYKQSVAIKIFEDLETSDDLTPKQNDIAQKLAQDDEPGALARIYKDYIKAARFRDPHEALKLLNKGLGFLYWTYYGSADFDIEDDDPGLFPLIDDLLARTGNYEEIMDKYEEELEEANRKLDDDKKIKACKKLAETYERLDETEYAQKITDMRAEIVRHYEDRSDEKDKLIEALIDQAQSLLALGKEEEGRQSARRAFKLELEGAKQFAELYPKTLELAEGFEDETTEQSRAASEAIRTFLIKQEKALGASDPILYNIYREFLIYFKLRKYDLADVAVRASELAKRHFGENSDEYASSLLTQAYQLWRQKRDLEKALALAQKGIAALRIFRSWRSSLEIDNDILVLVLLELLGRHEECIRAFEAIEREIYADYEGDDENAPGIDRPTPPGRRQPFPMRN